MVGQTAQLLFRPVLCQVSTGKKLTPYTGKLPACGSQYLMNAANLAVTPNANSVSGFNSNNIAPDPKFANIASTLPQNDVKSAEVLLPDPALPSSPARATCSDRLR